MQYTITAALDNTVHPMHYYCCIR